MNKDTICAIATALSPSGIGIVRISGEEAFTILDKVFIAKNIRFNTTDVQSHTIHYGNIVDGDEIIDEVLVLIMKGPHTYTRENTVEIDCHGGVLVLKKVLSVLLKNGGRIADPGEYTKRAYLNGRIDLSQAESVIDLIHSKNEFSRKSSIAQLSGNLSKEISQLRAVVIHEIAFIEAALDDPEHYDLEGYPIELSEKIKDMVNHIHHLIDTADNGRILREGIETVIIGKPNVGKSSLLNVLVGKERAIVTDIPGTTRDSLEEQINLDGITLNVVDTAGIRSTDNLVEKIGVEKSKEYIEQADLVIYIVDRSVSLDENDYEIMKLLMDKKVIVLLNKSDLEEVTTTAEIEKVITHRVIPISAKEQEGIDRLEDEIKKLFFNGEVSYNDEVVITNMRHKQALMEAENSFKLVLKSIDDGMPEDFYSIDLMDGYAELGKIIGEAVNDDLVTEIFNNFCMGK